MNDRPRRTDERAEATRNPDAPAERISANAFARSTPDILRAFGAFDDAVFAAEGRQIPLKFRELIALAVAITTQCGFCIEAHARKAVDAGATEGELAETAWVATAIRAGGGFVHGGLAFRFASEHAHGESADHP